MIDVTWKKNEEDDVGIFGTIILIFFFFPLIITMIAATIQNIACNWIMDCYQYDQYGECILYQKKDFGISVDGYHGYPYYSEE